ncbi:hypothetical protein ACQ4N7_23695 [Nodosilinea sp. AN01ver1]
MSCSLACHLGTSIQFNLLPLVVLAVLVGLVNHWLPHRDRPD